MEAAGEPGGHLRGWKETDRHPSLNPFGVTGAAEAVLPSAEGAVHPGRVAGYITTHSHLQHTLESLMGLQIMFSDCGEKLLMKRRTSKLTSSSHRKLNVSVLPLKLPRFLKSPFLIWVNQSFTIQGIFLLMDFKGSARMSERTSRHQQGKFS